MLDPLTTWTNTILALPTETVQPVGMLNLSNAIGGLMDKVQAGPTGSPGILTFSSPVMASNLGALSPSSSPAWAGTMASAWASAMAASVIAPGTVTEPAWTASVVDVATLPSAAATVVTLAAATSLLTTELQALAALFQNPNTPPATLAQGPMMMAQAFRDATSAFTFLCIGLAVAVPSPIPVPIPIPAQ